MSEYNKIRVHLEENKNGTICETNDRCSEYQVAENKKYLIFNDKKCYIQKGNKGIKSLFNDYIYCKEDLPNKNKKMIKLKEDTKVIQNDNGYLKKSDDSSAITIEDIFKHNLCTVEKSGLLHCKDTELRECNIKIKRKYFGNRQRVVAMLYCGTDNPDENLYYHTNCRHIGINNETPDIIGCPDKYDSKHYLSTHNTAQIDDMMPEIRKICWLDNEGIVRCPRSGLKQWGDKNYLWKRGYNNLYESTRWEW
uniref:Uncharacterized protein n=1 Tax=Megaviridae environmental sample TaxID=1737588 RepID=A0A5J6VI22_9VIRU|nr:MAG: hypothetical protein [Megaviridae environmental sample]